MIDPATIFRQLFEPVSSTYTYLIACPETREAALVDPVMPAWQRDLLGQPDGMMPHDDVGALPEPDLLGLGGDGDLGHQRVGAHLRALGLEMMLG